MCLKCAVSSTSTRAHIALSPMIGGVNLFVGLDSSNVRIRCRALHGRLPCHSFNVSIIVCGFEQLAHFVFHTNM